LPTVLEVLADVLTAATHPDAEVLRERTRLVERISVARAQPRTIAREALQRKRFGRHPIALELPTGPDVAAVEPGDVRALHRAGLVPGGAILTVVGDLDAAGLDPAGAVALVERHLGGWTAAHPARELSPPPVPAPSNLELVHRPGSVQSQLRLSAPALRRLDARFAALQLANLVFGGYFSSRWMENVREDKGYTYGAHSGTEFVPGGAVLSVETDVASDVTAAALLETRYELGRMTAVPPTPDEVDAARRYAVGSLLISLDSQGGYASTVATLAADGVPVQWLRDHPARLEAVTVEDVAAASREFFAPSAFTGVIVGDADVVGPGLRALGQVDLP
jgi:predicted Zn-dependent peptidase